MARLKDLFIGCFDIDVCELVRRPDSNYTSNTLISMLFISRKNSHTLTCTHKLKSVQKIDIASGYKAISVEHRYGYQSKIQAGRKVFFRGTKILVSMSTCS